MPERHCGTTRAGRVPSARGTGRTEQRHQPEPAEADAAALEHRDAELIDQVEQVECGHAANERQPEDLHHPRQQRRFHDLRDVPPQQLIQIVLTARPARAARTAHSGRRRLARRPQLARQARLQQRATGLFVM